MTSPRPAGHPSPVGEGKDAARKRTAHPSGTARIFRALLVAVVTPVLALACGRGRENAVIPGRTDLARQSRAVLSGKTYENREKIRQGMSQAALAAAVGDPSEKLESRGDVVSGHWTYLYADGKIVILLRDGIVTEVVTTFY